MRRVDAFINETQPFKLAKDPDRREELGTILYQCLEALRIASLLLASAMPDRMSEFWEAIGQPVDPAVEALEAHARWGRLQDGQTVRKVALFPRVDAPFPAGCA